MLSSGEPNLGPRHGAAVLAEFASCQMEYKFLSHLTGNGHYFTLVRILFKTYFLIANLHTGG